MFQTYFSFGLAGFDDAKALRELVFVKNMGVDADSEFDWFDGIAAHLHVVDEQGLCATGRMYPDGEYTRIDRICAHPRTHGTPYEDLALRVMLYKAQTLAAGKIAVVISEDEEKLYTPFGFVPDKGSAVLTRNAMRRQFTVDRDAVIWDSPCKHM